MTEKWPTLSGAGTGAISNVRIPAKANPAPAPNAAPREGRIFDKTFDPRDLPRAEREVHEMGVALGNGTAEITSGPGCVLCDDRGCPSCGGTVATGPNPDPHGVPQSFDGADWAREFCQIGRVAYGQHIDEAWVRGWFSNAIMRGYDEREGQIGVMRETLDKLTQPYQPTITGEVTTATVEGFLDIAAPDLIERMAEAIYRAYWKDPPETPPWWRVRRNGVKDHYRDMARAALKALSDFSQPLDGNRKENVPVMQRISTGYVLQIRERMEAKLDALTKESLVGGGAPETFGKLPEAEPGLATTERVCKPLTVNEYEISDERLMVRRHVVGREDEAANRGVAETTWLERVAAENSRTLDDCLADKRIPVVPASLYVSEREIDTGRVPIVPTVVFRDDEKAKRGAAARLIANARSVPVPPSEAEEMVRRHLDAHLDRVREAKALPRCAACGKLAPFHRDRDGYINHNYVPPGTALKELPPCVACGQTAAAHHQGLIASHEYKDRP